jgi:hypothetical protein
MKEYIKFILLGILVVFVMSLVFFMYQIWTTSIEDGRITEAKIETQVRDIYWYSAAYKVAFIAILAVCLVCMLLLTYSIVKSQLKKASVHTYKIGKHSEIGVHEKDLSIAAPIAVGLTQAEQLKQQNKGIEQAFSIYTRMADVQTKQIQAFVGKRGLTPTAPYISLPEQEPGVLPSSQPQSIPTFQELLLSGEIAQGNPMILGYENGVPRRGSFLDIYSAAVAGESGSGKTSTMLFLIGSGLVACGVRFIGIDPHYPHPNSLGSKTKPLWEAELMRMATSSDEMLNVLTQVERVIDLRLKQVDTDTTPVVLVIDELAFLSKTSIGSSITHTMERISTEGRKCAVYMLASSQTWLAARTGDSSVVRDTLTSAYVHRIKPKQANLLLQDKEEVEKVKRYLKQAGDVLFCPVNDESVVCKMPYTTEADMMMVAEMLQAQRIQIFPQPMESVDVSALPGKETQGELPIPPSTSAAKMIAAPKSSLSNSFDTKLVEILREQMEASPFDNATWQKQLAEASGVAESSIKKILDGKKKLTARTAKKLVPYLFYEDNNTHH